MTLKARITAIDRFIKGLKEDGIYTDLQAACVMAGWDSLAGALTPLAGAAPSNSGFIATDYDRGIGITGDGTSYLNSGRAVNADGDADHHAAAYITAGSLVSGEYAIGAMSTASTYTIAGYGMYSRASANIGLAEATAGLAAIARSSPSSFEWKKSGNDAETAVVSATNATLSNNHLVFAYNNAAASATGISDSTIAFYSIGSATGLAALDARVSTLMADLRAIEEAGFDRDAIAYIRAVEEADGAYLETSVKIAINSLVAGLKADSLWDAIGSSCLLCGPRTLAGALVPLRGDAPTAYGGWASGDYDRATGLTGDGNALYLDSNELAGDYEDDNHHWSVYFTSGNSTTELPLGYVSPAGENYSYSQLYISGVNSLGFYYLGSNLQFSGQGGATGFMAISASSASGFDVRLNGADSQKVSAFTQTLQPLSYYILARNDNGSPVSPASGTIAFYSIGTSLDLAKLDSHISSYVTAIGAAI